MYNEPYLQSPLPVILHELSENPEIRHTLPFRFDEKNSLYMRGVSEQEFSSLKIIATGIKITNHYLSQKPCTMQLCVMFRNV